MLDRPMNSEPLKPPTGGPEGIESGPVAVVNPLDQLKLVDFRLTQGIICFVGLLDSGNEVPISHYHICSII